MLTKSVDTITDILLSKEIAKYRNTVAFNRFVQEQSQNAKQNFEKIINNNHIIRFREPNSNIETIQETDGTIITNEYALVPFVFIQSETVTKPDGTKIYTTFYPSNEQIPAKRITYSPQSMITKTTHYDNKGNIKAEIRVIKNEDGSGIEEKIEMQNQRKTKRYFNKNNISTRVESYVNDKIVFRLETDENGNTKKEQTYNSFGTEPILIKEVLYHSNICYTVKEYKTTGELYSCSTQSLKK